jgi:hypothetical protein
LKWRLRLWLKWTCLELRLQIVVQVVVQHIGVALTHVDEVGGHGVGRRVGVGAGRDDVALAK